MDPYLQEPPHNKHVLNMYFVQYLGIPLVPGILLLSANKINKFNLHSPPHRYVYLTITKMLCIIQQQVPLPLPCFNFAQIAITSLTLTS